MFSEPEDLAAEHRALLEFVYRVPAGLVQLRPDGRVELINAAAAALLMPLARDASLDNLFTVLAPAAPDLARKVEDFVPPNGLVCDGLKLPVDYGGRRRLLSLVLVKLDATRLMATLQDVTHQVLQERLLKQQQAWVNAVIGGVADYALVALDRQGRVLEWNGSIGRVTGFMAGAVVGRSYAVFYPPDGITPERLLDRLDEAEQTGWSLDDGWRVRADGSRFWGSAMIAPLREAVDDPTDPALDVTVPGPARYCLTLRDMSEYRDAAEAARLAVMCDHLTGLANRRAFFDAAEAELRRWQRRQRPLSLVLLDVDHFKRINDAHGHPVGDAVLRHIAQALRAAFRQVDVVGRIGGEEFAVLLPSTDAAAAQAVTGRVLGALATQAASTDAGPVPCTASAGVATMDDATDGLEGLLKRADAALYAAKAAGRNTAFVHTGQGCEPMPAAPA